MARLAKTDRFWVKLNKKESDFISKIAEQAGIPTSEVLRDLVKNAMSKKLDSSREAAIDNIFKESQLQLAMATYKLLETMHTKPENLDQGFVKFNMEKSKEYAQKKLQPESV